MNGFQPVNATAIGARRWAELIGAFVIVPVLLALVPRRLVSVAILVSGAACVLALVRDPTFARRQLIDAAALRSG